MLDRHKYFNDIELMDKSIGTKFILFGSFYEKNNKLCLNKVAIGKFISKNGEYINAKLDSEIFTQNTGIISCSNEFEYKFNISANYLLEYSEENLLRINEFCENRGSFEKIRNENRRICEGQSCNTCKLRLLTNIELCGCRSNNLYMSNDMIFNTYRNIIKRG